MQTFLVGMKCLGDKGGREREVKKKKKDLQIAPAWKPVRTESGGVDEESLEPQCCSG